MKRNQDEKTEGTRKNAEEDKLTKKKNKASEECKGRNETGCCVDKEMKKWRGTKTERLEIQERMK